MIEGDVITFVLLPLGLGLLGFVEPCSIGTSMLLVRYLERKKPTAKLVQLAIFAATRAIFIGGLGAAAAFVGAAFLGFQQAGWIVLGALYVLIGSVYLTGRATLIMGAIGPPLARLNGRGGAAGLGILFGLNIPACAAPLLVALIASAGVAGNLTQTAVTGFFSLALFGLALSLPLIAAVLLPAARRMLDRAARLSGRIPIVIGLIFMTLGLWTIHLGLNTALDAT